MSLIFAFTVRGAASSSGSNIPAILLNSVLRLKIVLVVSFIRKVNTSSVGFQLTPRIFSVSSSARGISPFLSPEFY